MQDDNDSVKIHAVYSSVPVAKLIKEDSEVIRAEIIPAFKASVENIVTFYEQLM